MRRRLPALVALALPVITLAFAGCASTPGEGGGPTNGVVPPTSAAPSDGDPAAAWLDGGRIIGLVTYGSSSATCLPTATDVAVGATGRLTVTLAQEDGPCTRDYVPRVTLVSTPAEVDPTAGVEIELAGALSGDVELDAFDGTVGTGETDYQPSAGWTDEDDQLVLVTWGSSGCPPVVESVEATGPAALTVTFQTPPADQVCTADIAPRGLVVAAPGLEDDVAAQLTLTGGDLPEPVTIPVSGTP